MDCLDELVAVGHQKCSTGRDSSTPGRSYLVAGLCRILGRLDLSFSERAGQAAVHMQPPRRCTTQMSLASAKSPQKVLLPSDLRVNDSTRLLVTGSCICISQSICVLSVGQFPSGPENRGTGSELRFAGARRPTFHPAAAGSLAPARSSTNPTFASVSSQDAWGDAAERFGLRVEAGAVQLQLGPLPAAM